MRISEITKELNAGHENKNKNFVLGIIGNEGTGKTSIILELIFDFKEVNHFSDVVVYCTHKEFIAYSTKNITETDIKKNRYIGNLSSLFVLDDFQKMFPHEGVISVGINNMRGLFMVREKNNNNFIYSCDSFTHIPTMLEDCTTHYLLLATSEGKEERKFITKMGHNESLLEAQTKINLYTKHNGIGKHPEDKKFLVQTFPFALVNTLTKKTSYHNILTNKN